MRIIIIIIILPTGGPEIIPVQQKIKIPSPYLHSRHMVPIYRRMIILLRIFKKYQSKKKQNCENEIIISYFALTHLRRFFSIEKEEYSFHIRFTKPNEQNSNVGIWNYINEFIRIISWNNLNEIFQAFGKNYSIVTKKESFFSCDCDYLDSTQY